MNSLMQKFQGVLSQAVDMFLEWSTRVGPDPISEVCTTISRGEPVSRDMVLKLAFSLQTINRVSKLLQGCGLADVLRAVPNFDQVQLDNRCACLPLLKQAVESEESGSLKARQEYEKRRLTHIDFLPTYAQSLCEDMCKRECTKVPIRLPKGPANTQQASREIRHFIDHKLAPNPAIDGQQKRAPVTILGFEGCFSYDSAQMLLEILSPPTRENEFTLQIEGKETVIMDRFFPASKGPLGAAAAAAWQQMSKIALASVVLEDLLSGLPFQISEDIKRRAIETSIAGKGSPWAISDSRLVKNARALHELYESGKLSQSGLAVALKSRTTMSSQYIEQAVGDIEHNLKTKAAQAASASAQASGPVAEQPTTTSPAAESCIGNPKWEFYRAIHSAQPSQPFDGDFRQQHSALYRIYRTTNISLQECIDLVRRGADVEAKFVRTEEQKQQLVMPKRDPYPPPPTPSTAKQDADAALESDIEAPYTITGYEALLQSSWFQGLGATYKKNVERRLERVQNGNFGDWRRLQVGEALYELRFHLGTGQRVYFRFTGPNSIELLGAGPKGDQGHDLRLLG